MPPKTSSSNSESEDADFGRLFWAARQKQKFVGLEASRGPSAFDSATSFASERGWDWAKALLDASSLERRGKVDDALKLLENSKSVIPDRWLGLFYFIWGCASQRKGELDKAIEAYQRALDDPRMDSLGHIWNNLGAALADKGEYDEAIKAYRSALDVLKDAGNAWNNLGVSLAAKGMHDDAIIAYHKALEDPNFDSIGYAWNNLGSAYDAKEEYDEAIKAYRRALSDPNIDSPGDAWYNLGTALTAVGEIDEAIKAFRIALDDPTFDTPGIAWNNLGTALAATGDHDSAIEAYRKALEDPKFASPGYAWNNLGGAYEAKGEIDKAIDAYLTALADPAYDTPAQAWTNLAQSYAAAGRSSDAQEAFNKALASPDLRGDEHARARSGLQILESKIRPGGISPDDLALAGRPASTTSPTEIESGIIAAIKDAGDTQYEKYLGKSDSHRDDTLSILRGWSSAVTLLEGSERRWRGGGYFLKWRGFGIVIDPGFDFLRNFHDAGYHGREIAAVVVSHNHPDHTSDLKAIDDLRYELYKRLAATNAAGIRPYVLLWDEDTFGATKFGFERPQHQHQPIVMTSGFPQPIDLAGHASKIPIRLTPFRVFHSDDVPRAMGVMVELLDEDGSSVLRIGYTADTVYFDSLHRHLANCDVLIAHISQPSIEELKDPTKLRKVHLGYRGTARLLGECKPKLALIGEFWAGFRDLRIPLVKGLRQQSGVKSVLPAGLAMHLRLPSLDIECTECHKPTPFGDVKVAPPTDDYGSLAYLCPSCMIG